MNYGEALNLVRVGTGHGDPNDDQVQDNWLYSVIDSEYRLFRMRLQDKLPHLYQSSFSASLPAGATTASLPADFGRVHRVERLVDATNGIWFPVGPSDALSPSSVYWTDGVTIPGWEETFPSGSTLVGGYISFEPPLSSAETYRVEYEKMPVAGSGSSVVLDVPLGSEMVVVHRAAAVVRNTVDRIDNRPELKEAERIEATVLASLGRRAGRSGPRPGFRFMGRTRW